MDLLGSRRGLNPLCPLVSVELVLLRVLWALPWRVQPAWTYSRYTLAACKASAAGGDREELLRRVSLGARPQHSDRGPSPAAAPPPATGVAPIALAQPRRCDRGAATAVSASSW